MPLAETVTITKLERFATKFTIENSGCWSWLAGTYGKNRRGGFHHTVGEKHKTRLAYRFLYQVIYGDLSSKQVLDHLCGNPNCVNPAHLEPVTAVENLRRYLDTITHCKKGHEISIQSAPKWAASKNIRYCNTCHMLRERIRRTKRRQNLAFTSG